MGIVYYAVSKDAKIYYELGKIDRFIELKSKPTGKLYEYDITSISRHIEDSNFGIKLRSFFRLFKDTIIVSENHEIIDSYNSHYHCIGSVYKDANEK
jgi:hypothetical protein